MAVRTEHLTREGRKMSQVKSGKLARAGGQHRGRVHTVRAPLLIAAGQ